MNGLDVYRVIGAGKQGSKIEKLVGRRIGFEKVGMVCGNNVSSLFPRVSNAVVSDASNAAVSVCVALSAKNPEDLVGVVLAGADGDG